MKFSLSIILAIVVASVVASSYSEEGSSTEITDPRVKILDVQGSLASAIVNEKTNTVYVTDFYAGKLHIIDGNTDEVIESIKVIKTPFALQNKELLINE